MTRRVRSLLFGLMLVALATQGGAEQASVKVAVRTFVAPPDFSPVARKVEDMMKNSLRLNTPPARPIEVSELNNVFEIRDLEAFRQRTHVDFLIDGQVFGGMREDDYNVRLVLTGLDGGVEEPAFIRTSPLLSKSEPALLESWVEIQVILLRRKILGEPSKPTVYLSCLRFHGSLEDGDWLRYDMPASARTRLDGREPGRNFVIRTAADMEGSGDPCKLEARLRRWFDYMVRGDVIPKNDSGLMVELEVSDVRNYRSARHFESSWPGRDTFLDAYTETLCRDWNELFPRGAGR